MQPEKNSRVDTVELKGLLLKKVGTERFKKYFYYLNRFINQKLSKSEFDKSCYRILGRENLSLHNQIIRAILKNACSAKVPPTVPVTPAGRNSSVMDDGVGQPAIPIHNQNSVAPIWSNGGGVFPLSPRKVRSGIRDRKVRDRPSPLGPTGKLDSVSHQSTMTATEDGVGGGGGVKTSENGDLAPCDYQRSYQHHMRGLAEQSENEERVLMKMPSDVLGFVQGIEQNNNVAVLEDGEEVEQGSSHEFLRSPLLAPLGIPFCSASTGGARKALPLSHIGDYVSFFDDAGLSDSETLRKRMEQIAVAQGVGGVTMECANTLNNMLDVYLKRLLKSCVELARARSTSDMSKHQAVQNPKIHGKLTNGQWPSSNNLHLQSSGGPSQEHRVRHSISLLDFKVAAELNPQQLGEDWPTMLEKISIRAFEE